MRREQQVWLQGQREEATILGVENYLSSVRYMNREEWLYLSSYPPNYFSKVCVERALLGTMRFLTITRSDKVPGCMGYRSFPNSQSMHRHVKPPDFGGITSSQIHRFCDDSQSAYGEVSYLRLVNLDGRIHCSFLIGKSRLAPLKQTTIPRLE